MNRLSGIILIVLIMFLPGCTWVKPTVLGEDVSLVEQGAVEKCEKLGTTTSYVKHTLGPIDRNKEKVREELVTLAKNRAAEMGGNTIVAEGQPEMGNMSFKVYWCGY